MKLQTMIFSPTAMNMRKAGLTEATDDGDAEIIINLIKFAVQFMRNGLNILLEFNIFEKLRQV